MYLKQKNHRDGELNVLVKNIFTQICQIKSNIFIYCRSLLAVEVVRLFVIDPIWTKSYVLPLFTWSDDVTESIGAWSGFLWSPQVYPDFMSQLKPSFLGTFNHLDDLGETAERFLEFAVYTALYQVEGYSLAEFGSAFRKLEINQWFF